jgi:SAM-dependent methyltransferase
VESISIGSHATASATPLQPVWGFRHSRAQPGRNRGRSHGRVLDDVLSQGKDASGTLGSELVIHSCSTGAGHPNWQLPMERRRECRTDTQHIVNLSAYSWALQCLSSSRKAKVLDAACGAGFGSYAIGEDAEWAVGVDLSAPTVAEAGRSYRRPNLSFAAMDCGALGFLQASFDAVLSFETEELLAPHFRSIARYGRRLGPRLARLEEDLDRVRRLAPAGARSIVPRQIRHILGSLVSKSGGGVGLEEVNVDDVEGLEDTPTLLAIYRRH